MGQKVHPLNFRLGLTTTWKSRWYARGRDYITYLRQDVSIRSFAHEYWKSAGLARVDIERSPGIVHIFLTASRPGVIIGRAGSGVVTFQKEIKKRFFPGVRVDVKVDIQEVRSTEENAHLVAQAIAEQLERRVAFKRAIKNAAEQSMKLKTVRGVRVEISGRLGGADMSRRERIVLGTIPLHTLRANIDFSHYEARTTYGVIGVKVWIYKGDVFSRVP